MYFYLIASRSPPGHVPFYAFSPSGLIKALCCIKRFVYSVVFLLLVRALYVNPIGLARVAFRRPSEIAQIFLFMELKAGTCHRIWCLGLDMLECSRNKNIGN